MHLKWADEVLHAGVKGITDLITKPGLINLDFADIHAVMNEKGKAMMGTGEAEGENRAVKASEAAISNPLLDHSSMKGARGVLINITGGMDMTLFEVDEAANRIKEEVDPNANIIFGSAFDVDLEGKLRVSVVATGIDAKTVKIIDNNLVNKLGDISITNKEPSKEVKVEVTNKEQFIDNQEESVVENKKDSPMHVKHLNTSNNDDKLSSPDDVDEKDENYIPKQNSFYFNLNKNNHEYKKHDEKELNNNSSDKEEVVNKKDFNKIKSSSSIFEIPTFLRNKKD